MDSLSAFHSQSFCSARLHKKDFRSSRAAKLRTAFYALGLLFFLTACKKEEKAIVTEQKELPTLAKEQDTISKILKSEKESNQNILTVDASKMPIRLDLEIQNPEEQIILKLENLNQPSIKAYLKTATGMNLRINQIRMPDNTFDGPFGTSLQYNTPQKGEYWLILAKNNMADGLPVGKFFLRID